MSASIEDILLLKAQQKAAQNEENGLAEAAGGTLGLAAGAAIGIPIHQRGQERLMQRLHDRVQIPQMVQTPMGNRIRPGGRMAGALVGLMAGGALGAGVQQLTTANSPEAKMLARIQTGDPLTDVERQQLQQILENTYNDILS